MGNGCCSCTSTPTVHHTPRIDQHEQTRSHDGAWFALESGQLQTAEIFTECTSTTFRQNTSRIKKLVLIDVHIGGFTL